MTLTKIHNLAEHLALWTAQGLPLNHITVHASGHATGHVDSRVDLQVWADYFHATVDVLEVKPTEGRPPFTAYSVVDPSTGTLVSFYDHHTAVVTA
jgi:hypothetical protein